MFFIEKYVKHFGRASVVVIIMTFVLFAIALFTKGFTHDLLLEVAIFLVSVKLILMTYSNSVTSKKINEKLDHLDEKLEKMLPEEPQDKS